MTKLLIELKGVIVLLAIAFIWGLFIFGTYFGYFQLAMAFLCALLKLLSWPINQLTHNFSWHSQFMDKFEQVKHQLKSWCFTLWLSNDQYINSLFNGLADHTISGRIGYLSLKGNRVAQVMEAVIDFIFLVVVGQRQHCRESIEWDEIKCRK